MAPFLERQFHLARGCDSQELVEASSSEAGGRRLAALDAAVVYVHGSPRGTCDGSLELLEQAGIERLRIEGAGHWPFLDQHDAFVEVVVGFLDRQSPVISAVPRG